VRTAVSARSVLVLMIDDRRQRMICPAEGADMVALTEGDLAAFRGCARDGHLVAPWRAACECGTIRA
jgi:hypothetical protein